MAAVYLQSERERLRDKIRNSFSEEVIQYVVQYFRRYHASSAKIRKRQGNRAMIVAELQTFFEEWKNLQDAIYDDDVALIMLLQRMKDTSSNLLNRAVNISTAQLVEDQNDETKMYIDFLRSHNIAWNEFSLNGELWGFLNGELMDVVYIDLDATASTTPTPSQP